MNKFIGFLLCCLFLGVNWACDDDEEVKNDGQVTVSLGSKEFKTLENITPLRIPVALSAAAPQPVSVTGYIKSENNAKEGVDYTFVSKQLVIPQGKSSGFFEVEIKDYPEYMPDRTFEFEIVGVEGAKLSELDVCRVIIMSNEGLPVLGFANTLATIGEEMQQLETELEELNQEKTVIENALNSGTLSSDELIAKSNRIAEIIAILDEKEMRWLELSEI